MVFQDPMSSLNPALRVGRQIAEVAEVHAGASRSAAMKQAALALASVGIPDAAARLSAYPHELSGGMRQRAVIAMGLMEHPQLLLADEPTTALDVTVQKQFLDLLLEVNRTRGTAILLVSHDIAVVGTFCERVLVMYAGRIVEEIPSDMLLGQAAHPYTRALLAAVPDMSTDRTKPLATIPGRPPAPGEAGSGCAFAPRCPLAIDRCRHERPELVALGSGHRAACWVTAGGEPASPAGGGAGQRLDRVAPAEVPS
jgi:oligopeptide/dipeptide ABC transporter ATP-binding protein